MYRPALGVTQPASLTRLLPKPTVTRRFLSTAPPHRKSRSWKSSATRWGLAGAVVYYYNSSVAFAEEPAYAIHAPLETSRKSETYHTVESISEQKRRQAQATAQTQVAADQTGPATATTDYKVDSHPSSPESLEEEASQQGAFNEETGEINWDCPCLGGMAHGPCGEQFRAAFSCFVYSKDEPKGVDCIEHFKTMQNCFREHPDIYGAELDDEDVSPTETLDEKPTPTPIEPPQARTPATSLANIESSEVHGGRGEALNKPEPTVAAHSGLSKEYETSSAVPTAAHDAR